MLAMLRVWACLTAMLLSPLRLRWLRNGASEEIRVRDGSMIVGSSCVTYLHPF